MFLPKFEYTHSIVKDLMSIEKSRAIVELLPIPADVERELRMKARVKMTHYSTRIEGNPLSLEQVSHVVRAKREHSRIRAEEEVRNYWEALSFLDTARRLKYPTNQSFIKRLHAIIERRGVGKRTKESDYRGAMPPGILFAVYDAATGKPDYIPPEWVDVPELMNELAAWINLERELPIPIKAAISAYQLLTIHPFEDGNGRTSRALASYILSTEGYNLRGFNSMEEYYFSDLSGYYKNLQMELPVLYYDGRHDPKTLSPWIEYFVRIMAYAFEQVADSAQRNSKSLINPLVLTLDPKERLLLRLLFQNDNIVKPKDISEVFQIPPRTAGNWMKEWHNKGLLKPASGSSRITSYQVGEKYSNLTIADLGYLEE
ncbi:Fic family protein [Saccharibacillus sp. CPCC 101409]|uniref:Fic family protein n=1 Tax=Saccharibacillus sp. CPCC 101409 TaxID=3058041 RepID=UPI002672B0B0|nr:Fic family protein [Saccharibacillus sp. CPCC 101409]MDO3409802.1 Fic family protein [Saccharibacillus sp. CPCC 101409]